MNGRLRVLFAGEGSPPGSGTYLLGALTAMRAHVTHVPWTDHLSPSLLGRRNDVVLFSDHPRALTPHAAQRVLAAQVAEGTGLAMIGGWASFSGRSGAWQGSIVERLLPIRCLGRDDRVNFPGGALLLPKHPHGMWDGLSFSRPPVICGLNAVRPKPHSQVLLCARPVVASGCPGPSSRLRLGSAEYPLLVVGTAGRGRVAALTTDAAPHWCGGLVDWGTRRVTVAVTRAAKVEVGDRYLKFFACLVQWLAGFGDA